jgi:hypothetical protein
MNKQFSSSTPIISVIPSYVHVPLVPEEAPVGTKVYAILRGGDKDGQIIKGEVHSYSGNTVSIIYVREDGIPAIELFSVSDANKNKEELEKIINPTRALVGVN